MSSFTSYELLLACRQPGCAVCRLEQRTLERYLESQLYESVNTTALRNRLRASLGFCREHAWLAVDKNLGDALGFAIIYRDVIGATLKRLEESLATAPARRPIGLIQRIREKLSSRVDNAIRAITPRKRCPACQRRDEITPMIISSLSEGLAQPELVDALQSSDGLCLPHLRLALEAVRDAASFEKLVSTHLEKLAGLQSELAELIRKNDHRFIHETFGHEGDAWRRAVAMVVGSNEGR